MPVIELANLQQVLQMSSAVEKVQAQQVQHLAADQIQDQERVLLDEKKRTELQDPEETNPAEPTQPDGTGPRRRLRIKNPAQQADEEGKGSVRPRDTAEDTQGSHLDIVV